MREAQWKDYELIDCSCGERLERWGDIILIRPDPQVIFLSLIHIWGCLVYKLLKKGAVKKQPLIGAKNVKGFALKTHQRQSLWKLQTFEKA